MCHERAHKPKSRLALYLRPYPHAWVSCHMLSKCNNHGDNLAHGTLDHVMVTTYHGVAPSMSKTNQLNSTKLNQCSM